MSTKHPKHWRWCRIGEAGEVRLGRQRTPAHHDGPYMVPYLRVANVMENRIDLSDVKSMNFTPDEQAVFLLKPGDILLNEGQSPHLVGRPAMYRGELAPCFFQNTLVRFRANEDVLPGWALLVFRAQMHAMRYKKFAKITTNIAHLGAERFAQVEFPLPPVSEQKALLDAFDAHESVLDAAEQGLKRVQAKLKHARASVLKAAVEGRLVPTEAALARAEGRRYEPGSALLARVLAERRARWAERGERGKYKEPIAPETEGLPELPEGWAITSISTVGDVQLGQQRDPIQAVAVLQHPYIRAANLTWGGLDLSDVKTMGFTDVVRYSLQVGDVLLSEASGSPMEVGKPVIWRGEIPNACYQKTVLRVRGLGPNFILPDYLRIKFLDDCWSGRFAKAAPGVGIVHITAERLVRWPLALPPLAEQSRIVAEVDRRLSVLDQVEALVGRSLTRCASLRQSILKRAFEGRLVPPSAEVTPE